MTCTIYILAPVLWICERLSLLTQAHQSFVNLALRKNLEYGGKSFNASEITAHVFSSQNTSFREEYKAEDVQMVFVTKQTLCKMPAEVDNSYQVMEMKARFNFEGRLLETNSEDVDITQNGNKVTVKTGDNTQIGLLSMTMLISLAVLIILIVRRWYIEKRQ